MIEKNIQRNKDEPSESVIDPEVFREAVKEAVTTAITGMSKEELIRLPWFSIKEEEDVKQEVKPKLKPVDLSVLIESGIDCEFWYLGDDGRALDTLAIVGGDPSYPFEGSYGTCYRYCQPRKDHVHAWQGGKCPLPEGFQVRVVYGDGTRTAYSDATQADWAHERGTERAIIHFEVVGLTDGYCYPWEVEE